jgi:hypothetical protein
MTTRYKLSTNQFSRGDRVKIEDAFPAVIGFRRDGRPIWLAQGSAPDDDDPDDPADLIDDDDPDDPKDDPDDDLDDDPKDPKDDKKEPPKPKDPDKPAAETKLEIALRREREARKASDRQLRALRAKNETDAEKNEREADEKAAAKYKPVAVKAAARAALVEAKWKGETARGIRLLDMDAIDVDEDGDITGLEDQVALLKADYADLFESDTPTPTKTKVKPGRVDGGGKPPVEQTPKTSAEKIAALVEAAQA